LNDLRHLDGRPVTTPELASRAAGVLRHMGLTENFAKWVLIVGHGSQTTNNAMASALDCGACGGHSGDLNARLLVELLNDSQVRQGLQAEGILIPEETRFIPALHETVTDELYLIGMDQLTQEDRGELRGLERVFALASACARRERHEARSDTLDSDAARRALNWAEVRPEWGLAGNACVIVAPRRRTQGVGLSSRSFLHDYDWKKDEKTGFKTLELIMTAPMVVTNWINLQYYASVVAPSVYGSGNKVLHNLVNENGVLEGNGGDLKVGLSIQSVHDGERPIHDPLRLSVFIEAPQQEIESIIQRHAVVRELVENEWLHLLQIDPESAQVSRRLKDGRYRPSSRAEELKLAQA